MLKMKKCKKCGKNKPASEEYYEKRLSSKDGLRNECKECLASYRKEYYEQNKEAIIKANCEYRKKNWDSFLENRKKYEKENKEILKEKRQLYYQKNKDRITVGKKEYARKNKERLAVYYLEWARNNVYKCKQKRHKREAVARKLPCTLTNTQWELTLKHFNYKCAYCGGTDTIQQEHFIPLSKGGGYTKNNIIPACKRCNASKQNFDFFVWYPKQDCFNVEKEKSILEYLGYNNYLYESNERL